MSQFDKDEVTRAAEQTWATTSSVRAEFVGDRAAFIAYALAVARGNITERKATSHVTTAAPAAAAPAIPAVKAAVAKPAAPTAQTPTTSRRVIEPGAAVIWDAAPIAQTTRALNLFPPPTPAQSAEYARMREEMNAAHLRRLERVG